MRAFSLIRPQPWYRADAFTKGLKAAGYDVRVNGPDRARPGDVLLIWNRYGHWHDAAVRFEREGGTVLVAENGYLNADGSSPKFAVHPRGPKPTDYYAIGRGFHNDHARVLTGGPQRWRELGVALKPWRTEGDHILICPNRSFGVGERVMQPDWAQRCAERLRKHTKRPILIRAHPGNDEPKNCPLSQDLKGAWAVFVWSSSCAAHALVEGIPAYIEAPHQILKPASAGGPVDAPVCPDREPHFETLANGQFRLEEVERGIPFRLLLPAGKREVAAGA